MLPWPVLCWAPFWAKSLRSHQVIALAVRWGRGLWVPAARKAERPPARLEMDARAQALIGSRRS